MQPDYLAFNSMSFSNGANRDTELQVIVYQYWNADEVVAEIESNHYIRTFLLHFLSSNLFFSDWKLVDLVLCEVTTYDKILQKKVYSTFVEHTFTEFSKIT